MLRRLLGTVTRQARRAGTTGRVTPGPGPTSGPGPAPGGPVRGGAQRDIERGARTLLRGLMRRR